MRKWYEMEACNQGPIIGGQVYLVRNIMGYPFEAKMNEEEQKALMQPCVMRYVNQKRFFRRSLCLLTFLRSEITSSRH